MKFKETVTDQIDISHSDILTCLNTGVTDIVNRFFHYCAKVMHVGALSWLTGTYKGNREPSLMLRYTCAFTAMTSQDVCQEKYM